LLEQLVTIALSPAIPPETQEDQNKYPYRDRGPQHRKQLNQEISQILSSVDDMIYKQARSMSKGKGRGVDESQIQEIVQKCRIWLWEKSIPQFNPARHTKMSTFLFTCIANFMRQEFRSITRRKFGRRQLMFVNPDIFRQMPQSRDFVLDGKIRELASDVIEHPEKYLSKTQVQVFCTMRDNPRMLMKEIATKLGYQRASSLSMMVRRIRNKIAQVAIEDGIYAPPLEKK